MIDPCIILFTDPQVYEEPVLHQGQSTINELGLAGGINQVCHLLLMIQ